MKSTFVKYLAIATLAVFLSCTAFEMEAWARAGGSKSSGSRGSRSMSAPTKPDSSQTSRPTTQQRNQSAVTPPAATPQRPSFARTMLTAVAGGFLGAMLFGGIAHAMGGLGGFGGSGIGLIEILLIGGVLFFVYRMFKKKKEQENYAYERSGGTGSQQAAPVSYDAPRAVESQPAYQPSDVDQGLQNIRQMDGSFDEVRFKEQGTDLFFKIQSAWGNRDLSIAADVLTDEMRRTMQSDVEELKNKKQINRIENIAVRSVELTEAWQESGQDFITVLFTANVLDYTVDEMSGNVVAGSKTDPVKFEEFWTVTRPVGSNPWRLSAINQA
jgi:predicted lipid-binding transport protein (Tim44 family)